MKDKKFDCVQMKWEIQRRLEAELPEASEGERRRAQMERVESNPILGPWLQAVRAACKPPRADDQARTARPPTSIADPPS